MNASPSEEAGALGRALRRLREAAALTREHLAERSGISVRTIAALELGTVERPRASTLTRLSAALDMRPERLTDLIVAGGRDVVDVIPLAPVPRELPPVAADSAGREDVIAACVAWLLAPRSADTAGPPVWSISGPPGVGKTTVAVLAARRASAHFPDGQVFVTFGGASAFPRSTFDVVRRLLLATGVHPMSQPETLEAAAALLRSRSSDRRMLFVFDDLPAGIDLTPMLPASAMCAVIVTARTAVASLPEARHQALHAPAPEDALGVLIAVVGASRVAEETKAARRIVELCDGLPLALRVAGARVATRPEQSLDTVADRLADERGRLDYVSGQDFGVRATLAAAYEALDDSEQAAFRLLGDVDAAEGPTWVIAAALDIGRDEAARRLERLARAHLVNERSVAGCSRYSLHDLTRLFARERAEEADHLSVRSARLTRLCLWWRRLAEHASNELPLTPERVTDAMAFNVAYTDWTPSSIVGVALDWFALERPLIARHVERTIEIDGEALVWPTLAALQTYSRLVPLDDELESVTSRVVAECLDRGDRRGAAVLEQMLAMCSTGLRSPEHTMRTLERCRETFRDIGDRYGELAAMIGMSSERARVAHYSKDPSIAADGMAVARGAVDEATELGDEEREVDALVSLAHLAQGSRDLDVAERAVRRAGDLLSGRHRPQTLAQVEWLHGSVLALRGELTESRRLLEHARTLTVQLEDRWGRARVGVDLAVVLRRLGERHESAVLLRECHDLAEAIGHMRLADEAMQQLDVLAEETPAR